MKLRLLLILSLLILSLSHAQEKKWNAEINYAVIPSDGFGGPDNVLDIGLKYRFIEKEKFNLGFGINGGFYRRPLGLDASGFLESDTIFIFQPRVFSEVKLPFSQNLKPFIGFGYTFFESGRNQFDSFGGFNFNLGLRYDLSKQWFIQAHYDYVYSRSIGAGFNNLRVGLGFKF